MADKDYGKVGRRGLLGAFGAIGGGMFLHSLATGIPAHILLNPLSAKADDAPAGKMLILSVDRAGSPVNANVPGMYEYGPNEIFHSPEPTMTPSTLMLGDQQWTAAKPWADLPQTTLDRACFFHHATYTPVHGEMARVMKLMDATEKNDMLVSHIARELAPALGTVQSDPVSLGASGGELLSSGGRLLSNVPPLSVKQALGGVTGPLKDLQPLRDAQIDRIYKLYKERGTPTQLALLDAWARSRDEVRNISTSLVSRLDAITSNNQQNQVRTAAIMAAMKISPVLTVRLDFGGDNHSDAGLANESTRTPTAVADIQLLMDELDALKAEGNLQHDVVFGVLNVFGRTLKKKGINGRDHHQGHHAMVLIGNGVAPGVIGGVGPNQSGNEYVAQPINSATGEKDAAGDIPFEDTLGAAGKTLGVLLGIPEDRMNEIITPGKAVWRAIA